MKKIRSPLVLVGLVMVVVVALLVLFYVIAVRSGAEDPGQDNDSAPAVGAQWLHERP